MKKSCVSLALIPLCIFLSACPEPTPNPYDMGNLKSEISACLGIAETHLASFKRDPADFSADVAEIYQSELKQCALQLAKEGLLIADIGVYETCTDANRARVFAYGLCVNDAWNKQKQVIVKEPSEVKGAVEIQQILSDCKAKHLSAEAEKCTNGLLSNLRTDRVIVNNYSNSYPSGQRRLKRSLSRFGNYAREINCIYDISNHTDKCQCSTGACKKGGCNRERVSLPGFCPGDVEECFDFLAGSSKPTLTCLRGPGPLDEACVTQHVEQICGWHAL